MGIRDIAIQAKEQEENPDKDYSPKKQGTIFGGDGNGGGYGGDYDPPYRGYQQPPEDEPGTLKVMVTIPREALGEVGDDSYTKQMLYDNEKAEKKAEELAYDQIEALAGKGFESRYRIVFHETDELYDEFEVVIKLIPISSNAPVV